MPPSRSQPRTRSPSNGATSRNANANANKRIRARLTPTTLFVSSARVRKQWRPLPTSTQDRIRTLLLSICAASQSTHLNRTSRSRNTNTTNPAKIPLTPDDYAEAITALTQKLLSRLPKMQFPPASSTKGGSQAAAAAQENDFDYENTLSQTATLSSQLTEANQSAKLLRASIRQEEADLRRERAELANLQENYKRSVAAQRDLERRLHPLAKSLGRHEQRQGHTKVKREIKTEDDDEDEAIADATLGTARRRRRQGGTLDGSFLSKSAINADEDLKTLSTQLRSHLGSMAANTAGLRGMAKELKGAEAAVTTCAWKGMSREKYEWVVGLR